MKRFAVMAGALCLAGACLPEGAIDADGDGYALDALDCDDSDSGISPDAQERCGDKLDNDCDGGIDEGFDLDGDGFSICQTATEQSDCDDTNPAINPDADEVCADDVDNNCDGVKDTHEDSYEPNNTQATAAYLGTVDNTSLSIEATTYLSSGVDLRDYYIFDTREDDVSNSETFELTVALTGIPLGLDLDLEVSGGGQRLSDPRPGNTAETVTLTGTRGDDSGVYTVQIKLMSAGDEVGVSCLPYTLSISQID